ncbi:MAG: hypothetical protein RLZZ210_1583 [Pseudomonadota bacterium]|jgi:alpha-1,3-rhamnosyl/mannosyltransferase
MKIILSVDALTPPLTGIGRYTLELAHGLAQYKNNQPNLESLKYYRYGQWIQDINSLVSTNAKQNPQNSSDNPSNISPNNLVQSIKKMLKNNAYVRKAYQLANPYITQFRLNKFSDHIYHGPNFYIPKNFSGKTIATIHDLSIFKYPQFHPKVRVDFMEKEINYTIKNVDFILTDSNYTKQEVIDFLGWSADKIEAVPLAAQTNFKPYLEEQTQAFLNKFGLKHANYILCLATVEPRKNIATLLDAYDKLPITIKQNYPLVIAGGKGWNSEDLHDRISKLEQKGWLKYLGYVDEQSLPLLLSGAKLFVFPSVYEGFGLPLLEAMACKVPVIASNASCLPEVANGVATLVDTYDVDGFTSAIIELVEDEILCKERGLNALEISKNYSWQATIQKTINAYKKV